MADLKQLLAQKAALEKQIEETQREQRKQAILQVRELMTRHGLSISDLQPAKTKARAGRPPAAKRAKPGGPTKVAVKYRNAETGDTWSGRGLQPRWLKAALAGGRKLEDFRV
jgi:DNA-binding protein H-NS